MRRQHAQSANCPGCGNYYNTVGPSFVLELPIRRKQPWSALLSPVHDVLPGPSQRPTSDEPPRGGPDQPLISHMANLIVPRGPTASKVIHHSNASGPTHLMDMFVSCPLATRRSHLEPIWSRKA